MAVFQQVILDKINGSTEPGTHSHAVRKSFANIGRAVEIVDSSALRQNNRNTDALGAPVFGLSTALNQKIDGFLGDYHHDKLISVIRKGRVYAKAIIAFTESDIGKGVVITPSSFGQTIADDNGIGEILGGGIHEEIGHYYYLDINLPIR